MNKNQNEKNNEESIEEINDSTNEVTETIPEETEATVAATAETSSSDKTVPEVNSTFETQSEPEITGFKKFVENFDKKIAVFSVAFLLVGLMAGAQLSGKNHDSYGAQGVSRRLDRDDRFAGGPEKEAKGENSRKNWDAQENHEKSKGFAKKNRQNKEAQENGSSNGSPKSSNQGSNSDVTSGASENQKSE